MQGKAYIYNTGQLYFLIIFSKRQEHNLGIKPFRHLRSNIGKLRWKIAMYKQYVH